MNGSVSMERIREKARGRWCSGAEEIGKELQAENKIGLNKEIGLRE